MFLTEYLKMEGIFGNPIPVPDNPYYKGDPDDQTLTYYEKHFVIPERVRVVADAEKCIEESKALSSCREARILPEYSCVNFNSVFKKCMQGWYKNEELRQRCTEDYLEERSLKRRIREKIEA